MAVVEVRNLFLVRVKGSLSDRAAFLSFVRSKLRYKGVDGPRGQRDMGISNWY